MAGGKGKGDTKAMKRKAADGGRRAAKKAAKDPNKPKRPPSAFFVFMEEFRQQFKEKNPKNKSVAAVGKAGGERWKAMSDADKAPYIAKAEKRKADYNKLMDAYNRKKDGGSAEADDDDEEALSDKSKSEVHDGEDESGEEEEDDD